MKTVAKHNLENRLSNKRKLVLANFIARISLSNLIELTRIRSQALLQSQVDFLLESNITIKRSVAIGRSITSKEEILFELLFHSIDVMNLTSSNIIIERVTIDQEEVAIAIEQIIENSNLILILTIIFYVMRTNDVNKQNVVSIRDIYDPFINFLS